MNWTLVRTFWLHRIRSRTRMSLLILGLVFSISGALLAPGLWLTIPRNSIPLTLLIAAGMISQDVASGAAQLILVRPVARSEYVLSRMAASAIAGLVVMGFAVVLGAGIAASRGIEVSFTDLAAALVSIVTNIVPTVAVVAMLSSFTRGLADLGIYVAIFFVKTFLEFAAWATHRDWVAHVTNFFRWIMEPGVGVNEVVSGGEALGKGIIKGVIVASVGVAIALWAIRRRELRYSD